MDTLVEKQKSVLEQSVRLPFVFSFFINFAILLTGYQILTEEEQAKAGIHLDKYRSEKVS